MLRDKQDIEAAPTGKGFTRREGDPHDFVYMTLQGQNSRAHTKPSHTPKRKEISDGLLGQMAKPFGLTKPEFLDQVDCSLSREAFETLLGNAASYESPDPTHVQCWLMAGFESKGKARAFSRTTSSCRGGFGCGISRFNTLIHIGHGRSSQALVFAAKPRLTDPIVGRIFPHTHENCRISWQLTWQI